MRYERESPKYLFIKQLIANIRCAVCNHRYGLDDIRIIGHQDELWVIAVMCAECQTQGLVFAVVKEGEQPEIITDLTPEEWARFQEMSPIDTDDVLDIHRFLRDFDGDFVDLFESA